MAASEKATMKNFTKLTEKHLYRSLFFIMLQASLLGLACGLGSSQKSEEETIQNVGITSSLKHLNC